MGMTSHISAGRITQGARQCLWVKAHPQFKSSTSGHTGTLLKISKQEIETAFFGDEKNVKDKSAECVVCLASAGLDDR